MNIGYAWLTGRVIGPDGAAGVTIVGWTVPTAEALAAIKG